MNGSCGRGKFACTASITSCVACGPVTASTLGCIDVPDSRRLTCCNEAPSHNDPAVGSKRFAYRIETFLDGIVDESTGIDDDQVGPFERLGGGIPLGAQLGQDQFRVSEGFGAARLTKPTLGAAVVTRRSGRTTWLMRYCPS